MPARKKPRMTRPEPTFTGQLEHAKKNAALYANNPNGLGADNMAWKTIHAMKSGQTGKLINAQISTRPARNAARIGAGTRTARQPGSRKYT